MSHHFTGYWMKDATMGVWGHGGAVVNADSVDDAIDRFWEMFYATGDRFRLVRGVRLDGQEHPRLAGLSRPLPPG